MDTARAGGSAGDRTILIDGPDGLGIDVAQGRAPLEARAQVGRGSVRAGACRVVSPTASTPMDQVPAPVAAHDPYPTDNARVTGKMLNV